MKCTRYDNSLGVPGEGVHTHVLGIAVLDVLGTLGLAWISRQVFGGEFLVWAFAWFFAGIVAHRMYCVPTTIDRLIFT